MTYLEQHFDLDKIEIATLFDELSFWSANFGRLLFDNIPLKSNSTILDVACGNGFPLFELAHCLDNTCTIHAVDIWKTALKRVEQKKQLYDLKNVHIQYADATNLPFESQTFDLIVSNLGINNFEKPQKVVDECFRTLKQGGVFALTSNLVGHFEEFYTVFEQVLKDFNLDEATFERFIQNKMHRGTIKVFASLLKNTGFEVNKIIEDSFQIRFLNGTALLHHFLVKVGFLAGWRKVISTNKETIIFSEIERRLNQIAKKEGELKMTVPMLYIEGVKK